MAVRHVEVDEARDIVGVRAAFELTTVEVLPAECGVTLLGDPRTPLYDRQVFGAMDLKPEGFRTSWRECCDPPDGRTDVGREYRHT